MAVPFDNLTRNYIWCMYLRALAIISHLVPSYHVSGISSQICHILSKDSIEAHVTITAAYQMQGIINCKTNIHPPVNSACTKFTCGCICVVHLIMPSLWYVTSVNLTGINQALCFTHCVPAQRVAVAILGGVEV